MSDLGLYVKPNYIPSTAGSGTNLYTGDWISIRQLSEISFQAEWSDGSSPDAAITVDVTNDSDQDVARGTATPTPLNLFDTTTGTYVASVPISGASGSHFLDLKVKASWIRLKVQWASGTANFVVNATGSRV